MKTTKRRGPTLFEAMSRAPVSGGAERRQSGLPSFLTGRRPPATRIVAEPLTEAQAAEEIALRAAEAERNRQDAESKQAAKVAKRELRQSRKLERLARKAASRTAIETVAGPRPQMTFKLSVPGMVAIAGVLCVIGLAAYSVGRHSKEQFGQLPTVAAVADSPTKSTPVQRPPSAARPPAEKQTAARVPPAAVNPELSALLKKPEPKQPGSVNANRPVLAAADQSPSAELAENLNYLQIESFLVTRERNGEQLAADLVHVRKFLVDRGVRTFARKRSNGYVLFAEQGAAPGKEHASERDALKKKVQQLGQEYRASGGLYQFKGCLFVSHAMTRVGDPV